MNGLGRQLERLRILGSKNIKAYLYQDDSLKENATKNCIIVKEVSAAG